MTKPQVEAILLGTSSAGAISGGDRHALEVWAAWHELGLCEVKVTLSEYGKETLERFRYALPERLISTESHGNIAKQWVERCMSASRTLARARPPAMIYSSSPYFYDLLPALALLFSTRGKSRLAVTLFHLIPAPWKRPGSFLRNAAAWLEQRVMLCLIGRFAYRIITDNVDVRTVLALRGISAERVIVSAMGIRRFETTDTLPPVDGTFVGRLTEQKGLRTLLTAWREVVRSQAGARLRLVGTIDPAFAIEQSVADLGLSGNVEVIEHADDAFVAAALRSTRFFVTASVEEGYGLSVAEALGNGTAVISFDLPAFRRAFPFGRIVAGERSADALAATIVSAMLDERVLAAARHEIKYSTFFSWTEVAGSIWRSLDLVQPNT